MKLDPITVLHVDDDPPSLDLTKTSLEKFDDSLLVITETSVEEGLATLEEQSIDCIVSDYEMPEKDGLDFFEEVQANYPNIPFILYTRKEPDEIAEEALAAGVDGYFQKRLGSAQYALLANKIVSLVEKFYAEHRLTYLAKQKHIADGGPSVKEDLRSQGDEESMSMAVIRAVADREGVDPVALTPPLHDAIDPDALNALFPPGAEDTGVEEMTISYLGYTITVSEDGEISIDGET